MHFLLLATEEIRLLIVDFKLEVLCFAVQGIPVMHAISKLLIPGLIDQLNSMKKMILPSLLKQHPQVVYCIPPSERDVHKESSTMFVLK